jgi:uncharacterized protein YceK
MFLRISFAIVLVFLLSACSSVPTATSTLQDHTVTGTSSRTPTLAARSTAQPPTITPAASLTLTTAASPTALAVDPLILSVYCDLSDDRAHVPTTVPSDMEPGWNIYQNAAYDFSFSYPADWTMIQGPHAFAFILPRKPRQKVYSL